MFQRKWNLLHAEMFVAADVVVDIAHSMHSICDILLVGNAL